MLTIGKIKLLKDFLLVTKECALIDGDYKTDEPYKVCAFAGLVLADLSDNHEIFKFDYEKRLMTLLDMVNEYEKTLCEFIIKETENK